VDHVIVKEENDVMQSFRILHVIWKRKTRQERLWMLRTINFEAWGHWSNWKNQGISVRFI